MEKTTESLPSAKPSVRRVRMACKRSGPRDASNAGRGVLRRQELTTVVYVMPQQKERTRTRWYNECTWTWGEDFEELCYITYE